MPEETDTSTIEFLIKIEGTFEQRRQAVARSIETYNELIDGLRRNRLLYGTLPAYEGQIKS